MKTQSSTIVREVCHPLVGFICAGAALLIGSSANAQVSTNAPVLTYAVDRSFTDGINTSTLVGTVSIPVGNYTIQNSSASPFTSVNLTLTVAGTPYTVDNALTAGIFGTGQFMINASPTSLTFNTANFNASNPADLTFSQTTMASGGEYFIGSDGDPHFEAAYTGSAYILSSAVTFPTVFGTAVPEPTTLALAGLGAVTAFVVARRQK